MVADKAGGGGTSSARELSSTMSETERDAKGELLRLLTLIAEQNVNVLDFEHHRTGSRLPTQQVDVLLTPKINPAIALTARP